MLDMIFDFDLNYLRMALWIGLLLTILVPYAVMFVTVEPNSHSSDKKLMIKNENFKAFQRLQTSFDSLKIIQFISFIRRKECPEDSDEPNSLLVFA